MIEARPDDLNAFYGSGGALKLWDDKEAWKIRASEEGSFYSDLLTRFNVRSVIDVSAASGFHAIQLAESNFTVTAIDGFGPFVEAGIQNQKANGKLFPFLESSWKDMPSKVKENSFDAAVCLGGSLHHTDESGIRELFINTARVLHSRGLFVVEQRNYEVLFADRPTEASHPCGWHYALEYAEPRTIHFHLTDTSRGINVKFEGHITFEKELLQIASDCGFDLLEVQYDHGRTADRSKANWIEYVFRKI